VLTNQLAQLQSSVLAQTGDSPGQLAILGGHLLAVVVFSIIGLIVFIGCLFLIEKLTPFSINKEILDEHNTAVAIVIGAIIIGMSLIIAASVLG
jgi:uncharacterized membrane protein YjfL (UPF0719 family)